MDRWHLQVDQMHLCTSLCMWSVVFFFGVVCVKQYVRP